MDSGDRQAFAVYVVAVLATMLASGCVRSKPPRTLVPLTTPPLATATPVWQPTKIAESLASPTPEGPYHQPATPTALYPTITPSPTLTLAPVEATPTITVPTLTITPTVELPTIVPTPTMTQTTFPTGDVMHVVARGETLLSIASRYRTTVPAIMNRNALVNPNAIYAGQQLVIPAGSGASETPAPRTVQHVVKAGETLSQLARKYRTTVGDILARNPSITDPNHLSAGTMLAIAVGTGPVVVTHRVRYGETLSAIARRYRVSVRALVEANGLTNPNRVYVGQVLIIPA